MSSEENTDTASKPKPHDTNEVLQCAICLNTVSEPMVTKCGHLFCWPCIHDWIEEYKHNDCPKCKSLVTIDELTPLYLPGSDRKDPRQKKVPPRPAAHAEQAPPQNHSFFNNLFGGNMGMGMGGGGGGFGGNFFIGFGGLGFPLMAFGNMGNIFGGNNNDENLDDNQRRMRNMMNILQFVFLIIFILSMFRQI